MWTFFCAKINPMNISIFFLKILKYLDSYLWNAFLYPWHYVGDELVGLSCSSSPLSFPCTFLMNPLKSTFDKKSQGKVRERLYLSQELYPTTISGIFSFSGHISPSGSHLTHIWKSKKPYKVLISHSRYFVKYFRMHFLLNTTRTGRGLASSYYV